MTGVQCKTSDASVLQRAIGSCQKTCDTLPASEVAGNMYSNIQSSRQYVLLHYIPRFECCQQLVESYL